MSPRVNFNKLWLASERDRRARELSFGPKTVLLGPNGTGKSRVSKSLYWCLGCEPELLEAGNWDPATVGALEFDIDGAHYIVVRKGRSLGLFSADRRLLFATNRNSEWVERTSRLFRYNVRLQRPGGGSYAPAGMDYMSLPFFIDQDGSWGTGWGTYANLQQFARWKEPVFATFTGLRPSAYLVAKQRKDEIDQRLKIKRGELTSQRDAFKRVRETLPRATASLDMGTFRAELMSLAHTAQKAQSRQYKVRETLIEVVNERQTLESKIKLATAAQKDLGGDFEYLNRVPDDSPIECPTCGVLHQTSFHARLSLASDLEEMSELVAQLVDGLEQCKLKEAGLRRELRAIEKSIEVYEQDVASTRNRTRLDEVLNAHSKRALDEAFTKVEATLVSEVAAIERTFSVASDDVKRYEDKHRKKDVSDFYSLQLRWLSDKLNIPANERVDTTEIGKRPATGGSSGRRAVLAVHLALITSNLEHGDTIRLPVVIDTLQQSGQDDPNLGSMFNIASSTIGNTHQLLFAVERLPGQANIEGFETMQFSVKGGLLRTEDFEMVAQELRPLLAVMAASIEQKVAKE